MKRRMIVGIILVVLALALIPYGYFAGVIPSKITIEDLSVPEGYEIEAFAKVPGARSMSLSSSGMLYIGTRSAGKVYALDTKTKMLYELASNLTLPNGVAFRNNSLYVAEISRILKFENIESRLDNITYEVVYDEFPKEIWHGWKFIRFGPDGKLYVPVGAPCNVCEREEPYHTITRMNPDGSEFEIFARGIRNTVGFDWHPDTNELWFTDNGRDWFGDDFPPDELNHAPEAGLHFGFPYCHAGLQDDEFTQRTCDEFENTVVDLGPHVAALGMRFYTGDMFPEFKNKIFIAEHGSWNRKVPIGYRVMVVDPETKSYEVFAEGWLKGNIAWGRPVDVEIMPDGSILVSDDKAGAIYRIFKSNK